MSFRDEVWDERATQLQFIVRVSATVPRTQTSWVGRLLQLAARARVEADLPRLPRTQRLAPCDADVRGWHQKSAPQSRCLLRAVGDRTQPGATCVHGTFLCLTDLLQTCVSFARVFSLLNWLPMSEDNLVCGLASQYSHSSRSNESGRSKQQIVLRFNLIEISFFFQLFHFGFVKTRNRQKSYEEEKDELEKNREGWRLKVRVSIFTAEWLYFKTKRAVKYFSWTLEMMLLCFPNQRPLTLLALYNI